MLNLAKLENDLKNKNIKEQFKQEPLRQFAKQIVQYQNFTASSAILKMNRGAYSECTAKQYFCDGRIYIKTGKKAKKGKSPVNLYKYIDEFMAQKLQPLMPKENEKYKHREKTSQEKEVETNKTEISIAKKQQPKQNNYRYGVLNIGNNTMKIYKDLVSVSAYQDACIDFGKEVKMVKIEIKEFL